MKPALTKFFEDYGKKKGAELFTEHLNEMEGIEGNFSYAKIIKLSKGERPEFNSERYLRTVKLFGKSKGFFPMKASRSAIYKNYFMKDEGK
jgi:hypothetical protein|tara:strand:+ start:599 stop:871 length:273 start_codon:yes stop_codon:yes gene_type:complete